MKKKNAFIMFFSVVICCITFAAVISGYKKWAEKTFSQVLYDNQKAYSISQRREVVSRIDEINAVLKSFSKVLAECSSEEEITQYDSVMKTFGRDNEFSAKEISYRNLSELEQEIDQQGLTAGMFLKLQKGQTIFTNVYTCADQKPHYFNILEPVVQNNACIGAVKGVLNSDILFGTNQTGFLRDGTETFILHKDGYNILTDSSKTRLNMISNLKKFCDEPEKLDELVNMISRGTETAVMKTTVEHDSLLFISVSSLPYNDWVIFNTTSSDTVDHYITDMAAGGQKQIFSVICAAAVLLGILLLYYYQSNKKQRTEKSRSMLLANFSDTVICEYDPKYDRIRCTSNITKMLSLPDNTIENFKNYVKEEKLIYPEDLGMIKKVLSSPPHNGEIQTHEIRIKNCDGEYQWYSVDVTVLYIKGKTDGHLILKITDISETKKKVLGLVQKTQMDVLTGLLNREAFQKKTKEYMASLDRGYLFLIDLDNFKLINDRYGHQTGDKVIALTAECMKKCFRGEDLLGRFGGDEFLVYMPGNAAEKTVKERGAVLQKMISETVIDGFPELKISCSIGIARYKNGEYKTLLEKADKAMYKAKNAGRNTVCYVR